MRRIWRSRSAWTFFGLNEDYIELVYEQLFNLKHYGGWSFFEAYNLPVNIRVWMLNRLVTQKQRENEAMNGNDTVSSAPSTFKYDP
mgnify:CR=1 FL=1|jgi:hypothetical protein